MNTTKESTKFDPTAFCMAFEGGELSEDEMINGFQELINSGLAWQLQGTYGRQASRLIEAGHCTRPATTNKGSPEEGTVRQPSVGQKFIGNVGPFTSVSRDTVRDVDGDKFRILVYGAYNAMGLIGSECNGIAILRESPAAVIADELYKADSGYFGPSAEQLEAFELLRTCPADEFRRIVNSAARLRMPI